MTWVFLCAAIGIAVVGALTVVAFESPIRSALGLLSVFVGVAAATGVLQAPLMPGLVLWVGAGGTGTLILAAIVVLNLTREERGKRRFRVRGVFALGALALLLSTLFPVVDAAFANLAVDETPMAMSDAPAVVHQLMGNAIGSALVAIAAAVVLAIAMVRRQA